MSAVQASAERRSTSTVHVHIREPDGGSGFGREKHRRADGPPRWRRDVELVAASTGWFMLLANAAKQVVWDGLHSTDGRIDY